MHSPYLANRQSLLSARGDVVLITDFAENARQINVETVAGDHHVRMWGIVVAILW
jgi:hypothetical protein